MKFSLSVAAAILAASFTSAQTSSDCNPTKKTCPAKSALGGTADFDFTGGASDRFVPENSRGPSYDKEGAVFTVAKSGDNPTIDSKFYIMFGHVEFELKTAPGTGIVSSAVLLSDALDEIDWEWLGGDSGQVQSNFFRQGNTESHDRVAFHANPDHNEGFHKYAIDWNSERIIWKIDGQEVRTLKEGEAKGQYPQTPMMIKAGIWAGGDSENEQGTIDWAGGETNYDDGPFTMKVKSIDITDYSTGKEYKYGDNTGDWTSIEAVDGKVNGKGTPGSGPEVESSAPPSEPTETVAPTSASTEGGSKTTGKPNEYPWIPEAPTTLDTAVASITSVAGLPSSWVVTDSGEATSPNTASETSPSASFSSPSPSDSSSPGGPEDDNPGVSLSQSTAAPTASSGLPVPPIPSGTGGVPGGPGGDPSNPSSTVAPPFDGAASAHAGIHYGLATICVLLGYVALL